MNVSALKTKEISRSVIIFVAGILTLISAVVVHFSFSGTYLDEIPDCTFWKRCLLTAGVAFVSMFAGHLLVIANQVLKFDRG